MSSARRRWKIGIGKVGNGDCITYYFLFLRARQMMISISSCVENEHLCEIQRVQTCQKWGSRKMSSFLTVEVGMHSDRARDYQTLHSDYFLRLNSI